MTAVIILGISTILQFIAAFLSLRLVKVTGKWKAWTFIAIAMFLMGIRRSITFYHTTADDIVHSIDLTAELVALTISILMVTGVLLIDPIFRRFQSTNRALQLSEEKYREMVNLLPQPVYEADLQGNVVFINPVGYKVFGVEPEDIVGKMNILDSITPEDIDRAKNNLQNIFQGEATGPNEYQMQRIDGSIFPALVYSSPIMNAGKISGIRGMIIDLTERRQAEDKIKRFSHIFEDSLNEIYLFDADTLKFVQVNSAAQHNLGYSMEEFQELTPIDLKPEFTNESFAEKIAPLRKGEKEMIVFETVHQRKDKSLYDVEVHLQLLKHGQEALFAAFIVDITERKKAEEELQKLSRAVESSSSAVIMTDLEGNIEYVNPRFSEITGYTRDEIMKKNLDYLQSEDTSESIYADIRKTITSGGEWRGEFHNRKKDGSSYWTRTSVTGINNIKGEVTHFVCFQEDLTNEYQLTEQLSYQATHDALTGLLNRHEFERHAGRLLSTARQNKDKHAVCIMDLDQFKVINDTCGHLAGDEMLRQISQLLKDTIRKSDILARLGGDEFGVLMEDCSIDNAHQVAVNIQNAIQAFQFQWEGQTFKGGVSIGLVPVTETAHSISGLLKDADAVCYMAKDMGRNRIHIYHPEDSEIAKRHGEMQWVTRIHKALEQNRFCLYAQAIISLDNNSNTKHFELLVRLKEDGEKTIPPDSFLPAAERYNLVSLIDRWVVGYAFEQMKNNVPFLTNIDFCSINISGQSLMDKTFLNFVISKLDENRIDGEKICFEITETAAILNMQVAMKFISTLKGLGCSFALDDFGSGLSSFGYLKNLPVDYLKIDGMFVKDIIKDPIDHAMVKSINEIGQVMGMKTIAEFVENDEIKGMLRELGVNYAQGYGVGKPIPFDQILYN